MAEAVTKALVLAELAELVAGGLAPIATPQERPEPQTRAAAVEVAVCHRLPAVLAVPAVLES